MSIDSAARQSIDKKTLEEGQVFAPLFDAADLIPAITQDADTGQVLMFAFMNVEALEKTLTTGEAHYWSRSRKELWHKGATSGHVQKLVEIRTDCDQDVLLLRVKQHDAACHQGYKSCFYRVIHNVQGETKLAKPDLERLINPEDVYQTKGKGK